MFTKKSVQVESNDREEKDCDQLVEIRISNTRHARARRRAHPPVPACVNGCACEGGAGGPHLWEGRGWGRRGAGGRFDVFNDPGKLVGSRA